MTSLFTKHNALAVFVFLLSVPHCLGQVLDSTFNPLITTPATVSGLITDTDGSILVTGNFQFVNGRRCDRIVRLNTDGTRVSSFSANIQDTIITTLSLQDDGKILLGGFLPETEDEDERGVVLRLMPDGKVDPSFRPGLFNDRVQQIKQLNEQNILVGGLFSEHAGVQGSGLVVLAPDGSLRQVIQLEPIDSRDITDIYQIETLPDGSGFYASGNRGFDAILHRFNADATIDSAFALNTIFENGDFMTSIQDIKLDGTDGLWFASFTWQFDPQLVRVDNQGSIVERWSIPNPQDLALLPDGTPLVATVVEGQPDAFRIQDNQLVPFAPGPAADEFVLHLLPLPDGSLIAAGRFSFFKGFPFESIMRIDPGGQPDLTFFTRLQRSGVVREVRRLPDNRILIGGLFTQVNQKEAIHLAMLMPDGTLDPSFARNVVSRKHSVNDLFLEEDGHILVATDGRRLNEEPYFPILRLLPDGTPDPAFAPGLDSVTLGDVNGVVATPRDSAIIGYGTYSFTRNGDRFSRIARFSYTGELDTFFSERVAANEVNDIFVYPNGRLLIGGERIRIGGSAAQSVIRIFPNGTIDSSFLPEVDPDSEVYEVFELLSTKLVVTGRLFGLGEYSSLFRLFPDGRIDRTFDWIPDNPDSPPATWPRSLIPQGRDSFLLSNRPGEPDALFLQMDRFGILSEAFNTDFASYTGDIVLENDSTMILGGSFIAPSGGASLLRIFLNQDPPEDPSTGTRDIEILPASVFPNPSSGGAVWVRTPEHWQGPVQVVAYLPTGQILAQTTINAGLDQLWLSPKAEGLVFLRLRQGREEARAVVVVHQAP
jgi:uncharacterized delta-60 repeat protein